MSRKTIFITGSSSGFGQEAAKYFAQKGWNVAATMRNAQRETILRNVENIKIYELDVTKFETVQSAVNAALQDFGTINVLLNNAGYGALGIFEKASEEDIRLEMETNVFGLMNVTKSLLPHFRKNKKGTIINLGSIAGEMAFPYFSMYNASKYAVNGFSKSLYYELKSLNIKMKLILPGMMKTNFFGKSMIVFENESIKDYQQFENVTKHNIMQMSNKGENLQKVVQTIFKAANSNTFKLTYPVGIQAYFLIIAKYLIPGFIMKWLVEQAMTKKKI